MARKPKMERVDRKRPWAEMSLAEYVRLRNGVPLGHPDSLRNMLHRSLGAGSFGEFWQYWNPIWSYGLGKYVYLPLLAVAPPFVALLLTFIVSGGIHDAVMIVARGSAIFLFTPWFFILAVGVIMGRAVNLELSHRSWLVRAAVNLSYLSVCLALTLLAKRAFGIP